MEILLALLLLTMVAMPIALLKLAGFNVQSGFSRIAVTAKMKLAYCASAQRIWRFICPVNRGASLAAPHC